MRMATSPPPTCWRATILTFAAFTIESAASTPAARPNVSTSPRAPFSGLTPLPFPVWASLAVLGSTVRSMGASPPLPAR